MTGKDPDPGKTGVKQIYAFDLTSKKMIGKPVFTIDLSNEIFNAGGKKSGSFQPSSLGIHPVSGEIYITDGPKSGLLVLDGAGQVKNFYFLDSNEFPQPEGISFNQSGEVFISTEGKKQPGAIMKVEIAKP